MKNNVNFIFKDINKKEWTDFLSHQDCSNFLQSWEWGDLHKKLGYRVLRKAIFRGGSLCGVAIGIIKNAKRGKYFEVGGGPIIDWNDNEMVDNTLNYLKTYAKINECVFMRLRPQLLENEKNEYLFRSHNFRFAPMHLYAEHTTIVDLNKSPDVILKNMRRQTRYEVKKSIKDKIIVEYNDDDKSIKEFCEVQRDTAQRQNFVPSSELFISTLVKEFDGKARIYKSFTQDGKLLSLGLVIFCYKEADYFEAASTDISRHYPGAYALQWRIINDAIIEKDLRYNLWGIAYNHNPKHRYAKVTTFKHGFGGEDVAYLHAQDFVVNKVKYILTLIVETLRKKVRGLY